MAKPAGGVVGERPTLLAAVQLNAAEHILFAGDAVEQIYIAFTYGRAAIARPQGKRPENLRSFGRPRSKQALFIRDRVSIGAKVLRPISPNITHHDRYDEHN